MGDKTGISWTDATWNPTTGCTRVSAGCDHCYAFQLHDQRHVAWKRGRMPGAAPQYHQPFSTVQLMPDRLALPLHWRKPRRIFVDSMSDLFHEDVPMHFIDRVFAVMALAKQHTFQVLTKRPERMARYMEQCDIGGVDRIVCVRGAAYHLGLAKELITEWPPRNVWLGTSVENADVAHHRIAQLLSAPAAVRFLSCEPLLEPLDLRSYLWDGPGELAGGLHWVIVGGESGGPAERALVRRCGNCGSGAPAAMCAYCHCQPWQPKPEALGWVRDLRDQCRDAGVPFLFKQWGGPRSHSGGRLLDGREWNEYPRELVTA